MSCLPICASVASLFLKKYFIIYSQEKQRETQAETQVEGEAGSPQGAQWGPRSRIPGLFPEQKADAQPLSHPGVPDTAI